MKARRIADIDLARFLALPSGSVLESALRAYNAGRGFWSYDPKRAATADLIRARSPLLGEVPLPSLEQIERQIRGACRHGDVQTRSNLELAKITFYESQRLGWSAVQEMFESLSIGFGASVRFWSNVVVEDGRGPFLIFFDHRRRHGLDTPLVRRIVFSLQHVGVRDRYPDLSGARMAIVRFPVLGETRRMVVHFHDGSDLVSYEDLDSGIGTVYETWAQVSNEQTTKIRKAGGGNGNPFGF